MRFGHGDVALTVFGLAVSIGVLQVAFELPAKTERPLLAIKIALYLIGFLAIAKGW